MTRTFARLIRFTHSLVVWGVKAVCTFYRVRNASQKRILIYTDSRGYDIIGWLRHRNPFYSYMNNLVKRYNVDVQIVPEFSTTLIDFLSYYERAKPFDLVILHCGIVDFSRRHKSVVEQFYRTKDQGMLDRLFSKEEIASHLATPTGFTYEGEETRSFYSLAMAEKVAREVEKISELLWIGCHGLVAGWRGNYWKDRPADMPVILDYSRLFSHRLKNAISLEDWSDDLIMRYTYDNVHLNTAGLALFREKVDEAAMTILEPASRSRMV